MSGRPPRRSAAQSGRWRPPLQAAHRRRHRVRRRSPGLRWSAARRRRLARAAVLVLAVLVASPLLRAPSTSTSSATSTRAWRARAAGRSSPARSSTGRCWLWLIGAMTAASVLAAAVAANVPAAIYVFLGAFTYGVVYTVWLKRRTWWNIVVGGLAGSFAVLAGAAAVSPVPGAGGARARGGAVPLDAAAFLEPRHRLPRRLRRRRRADAAGGGGRRARRARHLRAAPRCWSPPRSSPLAFGLGWIYAPAAAPAARSSSSDARPSSQPGARDRARGFLASLVQLTLCSRRRRRARGRDRSDAALPRWLLRSRCCSRRRIRRGAGVRRRSTRTCLKKSQAAIGRQVGDYAFRDTRRPAVRLADCAASRWW